MNLNNRFNSNWGHTAWIPLHGLITITHRTIECHRTIACTLYSLSDNKCGRIHKMKRPKCRRNTKNAINDELFVLNVIVQNLFFPFARWINICFCVRLSFSCIAINMMWVCTGHTLVWAIAWINRFFLGRGGCDRWRMECPAMCACALCRRRCAIRRKRRNRFSPLMNAQPTVCADVYQSSLHLYFTVVYLSTCTHKI